MKVCRKCGKPAASSEEKFCHYCGLPFTNQQAGSQEKNICENPECPKHQARVAFDKETRYCPNCGKLTTEGKNIEKFL